MPATKTFDYKVIDVKGKQVKGKLDAQNEAAAAQALRAQGVVPLSITESGIGLNKELTIPGFSGRVKLKDLAVFARQFATMTNSGLSLLRALSILEEQATKPVLQKSIGEIRADIENGQSLSASMAKQNKIFPPIMVAMIRAGETGGFLDDALDRLATNFEKDAALRGKIRSAMTYPVIVLAFSFIMIAGVMLFIVPIFERMFRQLGGKLPLPTQIIIDISHALVWLAPLLIVVAVGATTAMKARLRNNPAFRLKFDRFKLKVPVFGNLFTKIAISRFARNLGTLLGVGVPIMQALDVVGDTTGNAVISEAMQEVKEAVRAGRTMSGPLLTNPFFPPMVTQMVEVGEESGQISQMLSKVADFYDREVDQAAESLTAAIEPIMVLFMGAIVGAMVICLYLPMFSIYQHIQGANS
jgi:type IV pilus assembly protein PilC